MKLTSESETYEDSFIIYTDGACSNNGSLKAKAGIGVHFSHRNKIKVNDISEKSGRLFFKNHSNKRTLKLEYKHPLKRTLLLEKGRIRILEPTIKRYQEFDTKNMGNSSAFQLFWFGQSTKEIQKDYYVTLIREEVIKEKLTSLLELLPKSEKIKSMFSKINLWIDHQDWIPIKIQLIEASQDHLTTSLTNIKINPKLSEKIFRMKVPPDYDRIQQRLSSSK